MITRFNDFYNIPDINSVSKEFWKMTTKVNWKKVIIDYKKIDKSWHVQSNKKIQEIKDRAKGRLCTNYTYEEIKKFDREYDRIYNQLYNYFSEIAKESHLISDDGFSDVLSSIIGKGKIFAKKCINNPIEEFTNMTKNHDYVENFGYIFNISKEDYIKLKEKYDPLFRDTRKYNL